MLKWLLLKRDYILIESLMILFLVMCGCLEKVVKIVVDFKVSVSIKNLVISNAFLFMFICVFLLLLLFLKRSKEYSLVSD